jgi:sirohydrochlorin cobalto/nickelchelatase
MKSGVLVVGHGSKLQFNKDLVVSTAAKMAKMKEFGPVTAAFMQLNEPDIKTGIHTLVSQGVDVIYVQPCFLASGIHLTEDIPGEIGLKKGDRETKMRVDGMDIVLRYCDPIGDDDRIAQILADRVRSRIKQA